MTTDDRRFLFLLTYGRSGSTVVSKLIGSHPGVLIRGENGNMLFHLFKAKEAARLAARRKVRLDTPDDPWHGFSNINPDAISADLVRLFTDRVLAPGLNDGIVGFKEIRHTSNAMSDEDFESYVKFLIGAFAPARIVFLSRKLDSVMKSGWWKTMRPERVRELIEGADKRFAKAASRHEEATHVWFEDLTASEDARRALFSHANIPYDPAIAEKVLSKRLTHLQKR